MRDFSSRCSHAQLHLLTTDCQHHKFMTCNPLCLITLHQLHLIVPCTQSGQIAPSLIPRVNSLPASAQWYSSRTFKHSSLLQLWSLNKLARPCESSDLRHMSLQSRLPPKHSLQSNMQQDAFKSVLLQVRLLTSPHSTKLLTSSHNKRYSC